MQMYPAYNQSYYEEEDYSSKDEFQYNNSSSGMNMMKADRCPTPPVHGYQQNFDKAGHGYAAGNTHNLDKFSHSGGYDHNSFDKTTHGFGGHNQNLDKFTHGGFGGGYEQNFDKVPHGYAGNGHNFDKMSHGQHNFDKVSHGYAGNGQNFDKMSHGYAGNGPNFDKMSHGQKIIDKVAHGALSAGINLSFDRFKKQEALGHNAHQQQSSHFETDTHHDAWNSGSDFYAHGGNQHGYGNKFGSSMPHTYEQSGGYGARHGSPSPMPVGGHRPVHLQKGTTPTWNFKGISDF